jgi:hypothetical protein
VPDVATRCTLCGNYVDEEDLFCGNCGREVEAPAPGSARRIEEGFVGYDCQGCGASMTYDAEQQGMRCSFCGAVALKRQENPTGRIRPENVIPFEVSRADAEKEFRRWVVRGFFRPFGIERNLVVVAMEPVFLPCWRFRADVHTYYAADVPNDRAMARADWQPHFGEREGTVEDVLVAASGSIKASEMLAIEPFDFSRSKPYVREDLREHAVEDFGLSRRGARPRARALMLDRERDACADLVAGRSRNVHVNCLFSNLRSDPLLLPVWINAFQLKGRTYRFLVNGQTGEVVGTAPFSLLKLALVVGAAALLVALFFLAR